MDRSGPASRPPTRRKPFADATHRANGMAGPGADAKADAPSSGGYGGVPHNESFVPNGSLAVHHGVEKRQQHQQQHHQQQHRPHRQQSPEDKRLSALSREDQPNSKRNSAISNASTNASNTNRRRKIAIGPWHLGKTIGKGGCSRVRQVQHVHTGQKGAAKIISKQVAEKARAVSMANLVAQAQHDPSLDGEHVMPFGLEREIVIMKLLNHRNIVRLYDVWENRNELYLIMEYVSGGELFDFIQNYPSIEEGYVVYLFRQIIAALLYCHRIHIHHRDLKPENILIDHETMQIKLVDFGMAALQPKGKYLSTPCGSPHYAAPELLQFKSYDGSKADVWSCGVILYVMLTGTPPFNFPPDPRGTMTESQKLHMLFAKIKAADYTMPSHISKPARDLLYRIFQPNPAKRIDIESIWNHPFLHLYDKEFNLDPRMEAWIGKRPTVNDWKPLGREDIDTEIMRNMRMLWHSEKEEILISRLISEEANHEKYFYSELLKHREEHLENYAGPPNVEYSASDYQHGRAAVAASEVPPVPAIRSKSQYSILNNEHLHSAPSLDDAPPSDTSYDPFRASRDPVIKASRQYMNVTVHRGTSSGSRALRPSSAQHPIQRPSGPVRVEALRRESRASRASSRKSCSSVSLKHASSQRLSATRPLASRSSLGSSVWASSPPVMAKKPSSSHKRGVNFSHLRRSSTASALTVGTSREDQPAGGSRKRKHIETDVSLPVLASSPATKPQVPVQGRKEAVAETPARLRVRRPHDPRQVVDHEARKVSAELEKVCQEAFFRSSITTNRSSGSTARSASLLETLPSSVTQQSPAVLNKTPRLDESSIANRPLPPLPAAKETPKTFTARELAEMRNRIAARFAEANDDNADYFGDVLAHLDSLLPDATAVQATRANSAPEPASKFLDDLGYLPAISEEDKFADADEEAAGQKPPTKWLDRVVTEPVGLKTGTARQPEAVREPNTIRLVAPSSPCPIAPLNIRKASGASALDRGGAADGRSFTDNPYNDNGTVLRRHGGKGAAQNFTIFEDPDDDEIQPCPPALPTIVTTAPPEEAPKSKKRGWFFRRITSAPDEQPGTETPAATARAPRKLQQRSPNRWHDLDDRIRAHPLQPFGHRAQQPSAATNHSDASEFPMRSSDSGGADTATSATGGEEGLKRALWRLFRKRGGKKHADDKERDRDKVDRGLRIASPADFSSSSLALYDPAPHVLAVSPSPSSLLSSSAAAAAPAPPAQQSNWLAKFLHIRPASRLVCFQVGRGRVRQELVRLLRDWRRFGVRDVAFDRATNVVRFRIDRSNHLKMKPVSIVAELFVVLEHGRRAQLSVARFTQEKGAASSFRRTMEVLESVMGARGILVDDEESRSAMMEILS